MTTMTVVAGGDCTSTLDVVAVRDRHKMCCIMSAFETVSRLSGFADLEDGWCYGEDVAIKKAAIDQGIRLVGHALMIGFTESNAFPGIRGGVQINIYDEADDLELSASGDRIDFLREEWDMEIEECEGLTEDEAIQKIREQWARKDRR